MSWRAAQWLAQAPHSIAGSYPLVTRGFSVCILHVLPVPAYFVWVLLRPLSTKYRYLGRGEWAIFIFSDCECEMLFVCGFWPCNDLAACPGCLSLEGSLW